MVVDGSRPEEVPAPTLESGVAVDWFAYFELPLMRHPRGETVVVIGEGERQVLVALEVNVLFGYLIVPGLSPLLPRKARRLIQIPRWET